MEKLTQEKLKKLVVYDPVSGVFTRIKDAAGNAKTDDKFGSTNSNGYLQERIDGEYYDLHRLAFLYMTGTMPDAEVDHINHDRLDNRWSNLRTASKSQNLCDVCECEINESGYCGIYFKKKIGKWTAQIILGKKLHHLGYYDTEEGAHAAYLAAAQKHACELTATESEENQMALTKTTINDKIEILQRAEGYPVLQVRTATIIAEGGVEISRTYRRHVVMPNADLSAEDADVAAIAGAVFTDKAKAAYAAAQAAGR